MAVTINAIILAIALAALVWGAFKGFVIQIVGIIGIVLGLYLSSKLTPGIAGWLQEYFGGESSLSAIKIVVYVVLFIIILILCKLIGRLINKAFKLTVLGTLDRVLGAVFCLLKVILVLSAIAALMIYGSDSLGFGLSDDFRKSEAFSFLLKVSDTLLPHLKHMLWG